MFMLALEGESERGPPTSPPEWPSWLRGNPDYLWSPQITPVIGAVILAAARRFDEAEEIMQHIPPVAPS